MEKTNANVEVENEVVETKKESFFGKLKSGVKAHGKQIIATAVIATVAGILGYKTGKKSTNKETYDTDVDETDVNEDDSTEDNSDMEI